MTARTSKAENGTNNRLVLVGARRFLNAKVKADNAIEYMEEVMIDDPDVYDHIVNQTYRDTANNVHPMFVPPDHPKVKQYQEDLADAEEEIAASRARRRRRRRKRL